MAEIDRAHIGTVAQKVCGPLVQVAVHRGGHETDATLAVAVVLLQAEDPVVRERLDGVVPRSRRALRDTFDGADREPTGNPTRDLGGAKNPPRVRGRRIAEHLADWRSPT